MVESRRVIVIGGSMAGLFAGVLLARMGWDVTVHERSPGGLGGRGAGLVAQPQVIQLLEEIGAEAVAQSGVVARERIIFDRSGEVTQRMPTPQSQISWNLLYEAFLAQIPEGKYLTGSEIEGIWQDGERAMVRFRDGRESDADLVIGADGIGSVAREFVAPGSEPSYSGYVAFRGLLPEADVPKESAEQLLERFAFYNQPGGQMLGYLVAGSGGSVAAPSRRYNWVWYRPRSRAELKAALTDASGVERRFSLPRGSISAETLMDLQSEAVRLLPPVFANVVLQEPAPFVQPIFDYETPVMRRGCVALLGDAAFVVRPHTAMGVSKAAGDAMTLRDCLKRHADLDDALQAYADLREEEGRQIAAYGQLLGASFGWLPKA